MRPYNTGASIYINVTHKLKVQYKRPNIHKTGILYSNAIWNIWVYFWSFLYTYSGNDMFQPTVTLPVVVS